ncbi:MAG: proteasome accessory factor [Nocardioidaceae bacterium]|nr:proteasome accessory factor [Nocardioidaceae bacterium]
MTARAQSQVARMLELVPYLQARNGVPVADVARDFGVTPTQIVKDLNVLWFCGLPNAVTGDMIDVDMEALQDDGVVRLSNAEYLTRPLRLSASEALALIVALRALAESAGPRERAPVDRVLAKIEAAAGERSSPAAAVDVQLDQGDPQIREAVDAALRDGRQLQLSYYVASRDETTDRVADPLRLVYFEGRPYLEAWCHRARETRLFRVDSITSATVLDSPAEPPVDVPLLDMSRGAFQPNPDDPVAVVDLDRSARWVADYYPTEATVELADGRLRVEIRYADARWLQRLVMRLGGAARVVEPSELAESVRELAARTLAYYEAG